MLRTFLLNAKKNIIQNGQGVYICVGNEAGDLDSIVSAVVSAFWYSQKQDVPVIPVASFARREFTLRRDAVKLFSESGFSMDNETPKDMLFWDELGDTDVLLSKTKGLLLTDHNQLTHGCISKFGSDISVCGIIDHHTDAGMHSDIPLRIVDPSCGSASSLAAQQLLAQANPGSIPEEILQLVYGTILLDTRNFDPEQKKYNAIDQDVFKHIRDLLGEKASDPSVLYKQLMDARHDVSHLDVEDLLRVDYKSAKLTSGKYLNRNIGFSSVLCSLPSFIDRTQGMNDHLQSRILSSMDELNVDALVILCSKHKHGDGIKRKGLILATRDSNLSKDILVILNEAPSRFPDSLMGNPLFETQMIYTHGFEVFQLHEHDNVPTFLSSVSISHRITRKAVIPTIMQVLENA